MRALLAANFAIPQHQLGPAFVPRNQEEADTALLIQSAAFAHATGISLDDLGEEVQRARYRQFKRQIESELASTERWLAERQRRRATYGDGLSGRLREWWGER